ncbi:hypothetical protein niasHT_001831 [Heterodera trifolii]|uniref:Uncharacterized protein n=1 Tax=Heterodera trifolii TaxID=157864 RepID=A0ABD2MBU5_9BILA
MVVAKNICRTKRPFSDLNLLLFLSFVLCSEFIPATNANENGRSAPWGRRGAFKVIAFRPRRALDILESDGFGGFRKRALDVMDGDGFGSFQKRALDSLEGDDFMGLKKKRALTTADGDGFTDLGKRALDVLDGDDFVGFRKRSEMQKKLALLDQIQHRQMRARRALDALEGNAFGFRR